MPFAHMPHPNIRQPHGTWLTCLRSGEGGRRWSEWFLNSLSVGFMSPVWPCRRSGGQTDQFFKINNNIATDLGIYVKNYSLNFWQLMHYQHSTLMLIIIHWWPVGWLPKCIHFIHICMLNLISISYFCVGEQWKHTNKSYCMSKKLVIVIIENICTWQKLLESVPVLTGWLVMRSLDLCVSMELCSEKFELHCESGLIIHFKCLKFCI